MANRRYSRILEAAKYYSSIDNYIQYITNAARRGQNVGTGTARPPSQVLYVRPFNVDLAAGQLAKTSAAAPSWTTYASRFGTHVTATAPTDAGNIVKIADFRAARVVITTGRSGTGTVKTSKVTGQKYLDYGGKSTSIPFGQTGAITDQEAAFNAIKNAIVTNITPAPLVTLQPEKF